LFGDEPTGNLDEINSRELMTMLRDNIQQHGRTAIIVTHNIDLALEFGDQIIILTKDNEEKCGQIDPENIFYRPTNPNANAAAWHTRQAQYNNVQMRPVIEQLIH
jgi:energy-coupling factor transporter ATP-binding protein EcfA2